jgi:hypothetical protein
MCFLKFNGYNNCSHHYINIRDANTIFINQKQDFKALSVINEKQHVHINYTNWMTDKLIHENIFPQKITQITFGPNFEGIINNNCLPNSLDTLILHFYKHHFYSNTFPLNLESLEIINYNFSIKNLPPNLKNLCIGNKTSQFVILPHNLHSLNLGSSHVINNLPTTLTKLTCLPLVMNKLSRNTIKVLQIACYLKRSHSIF